jgi:hypothetical protein
LNLLDTLITSKTRVKLLVKFFLNPGTSAYLRSLEAEFGESTNAIRLELNRLEKAGMLEANSAGNKKVFQVNQRHPLFEDINMIVRKYVGIDIVVENIVSRLGNLQEVYLVGDLAQGRDTKIIDLEFVGQIDRAYLVNLIEKAERLIDRKVRFVVFSPEESYIRSKESLTGKLLLWSQEV